MTSYTGGWTASYGWIEAHSGCPSDVVREVRVGVRVVHAPGGIGNPRVVRAGDPGTRDPTASTSQTVMYWEGDKAWYGPGTLLQFCVEVGYLDIDRNYKWSKYIAQVRVGSTSWSKTPGWQRGRCL